ncbi:MAG: galactokinase [Candidatus Omnitrophota bacterium]|jgi:galactokinase|nr:MAG: galactokinase [Candidatus Omnitrophota bacterium]
MNQKLNGAELYQERYGASPAAASKAPGRVEILGNHTDYNGGYVLTVALDKAITIHGERLDEPFVTVYSSVFDEENRFPIHELQRDPNHPWANYVKGVLFELKQAGIEWGGFRAVIAGNLPIGAGVSSSAALEMAVAFFVQALYPYQMEKMQLAKLCQRAENNFVGMPCGILDQFSSIFGENNAFLFLDCDTLEHKVLPLPSPAPAIILCNTHVKHELVESEYKTRRRQCEAAAQTISEHIGRPVRFLRDISLIEFKDFEDMLDNVLRCRARHVMYENQRVLHGVSALQIKDLSHLGELMRLSHSSSRDLFENSCEELDVLVEEAQTIKGCIGMKLTGGGFGGCTVNLVESDKVDSFTQVIRERYAARTGRECDTMVCGIGEGAGIVFS